ncbi:unnamed protein product [Mytilus edulis]|uniref:EGF-like domain-containing protein n=1 Tax=Mytilus edulis TaxID=6550 RepID=A0A8S3TBU5_MYTED|nr:unnamed protein product [Mytilus edulis]
MSGALSDYYVQALLTCVLHCILLELFSQQIAVQIPVYTVFATTVRRGSAVAVVPAIRDLHVQIAVQIPVFTEFATTIHRDTAVAVVPAIRDLHVQIAVQIPVFTEFATTIHRDTAVAVVPAIKGSTCTACMSAPCLHGTCHASLNGYKCTCEYGYTGSSCDTGDPATRAITFSHFDLSPKPILVPGNITTAYDITIHRKIAKSTHLRLNVTMDKKLLHNWHTVPCAHRVGTW